MKHGAVNSSPYPWPYRGNIDLKRTALLVSLDLSWIPNGKRDYAALERMIEIIERFDDLAALVFGFAPKGQLWTVADNKTAMSREEQSWRDVAKTQRAIETIGSNAFYCTDLDQSLREAKVTDLVLIGLGLESPLHSSMRSANDMGYECLLVSDATIAWDDSLKLGAVSSILFSGGIFGAVTETDELLMGLDKNPKHRTNPTLSASAWMIKEIINIGHSDWAEPKSNLLEDDFESSEAALYVDADPYPWPYDGVLDPAKTAFISIDWQVDFCGRGGYVEQMGYDLSLTRTPLAPTAKVLSVVREWGCLVIHTREGHRPDLSDCPPNKLWRSKKIGAGIGDSGPCGRVLVRGEPGWEIVEEVAPIDGEIIIDKPGKGSFYATDLDLILRTAGITHLIITGITTDVCVHTTLRDANDRGYECLLLSDCTAATDVGNHEAALKMVKMQGGVFGAVATSEALMSTIARSTVSSQAK